MQTPRSTRPHAPCWTRPAPPRTLYISRRRYSANFYSVITNPRRVRVVSSSVQALGIISAMLALPGLYVLPTPARAVAGWMQLLQRNPVTGGAVFDLQIVATMQANGIQRIHTFNRSDPVSDRRKAPAPHSKVSGSTSITSAVAPHFCARANSCARFNKAFSSFRLPDLISN